MNRWYSSTSSTASGYWMKPQTIFPRGSVEAREEITEELKKIAKEMEEDKEKHLPIFDPKDLDI